MRGKTPPTEPLTSNERRRMLVVVGLFAALVIGGVTTWQILGSGSTYDRSSNGCVNVSVVTGVGGGLQHECGAAAQTWCRSAYQLTDSASLRVQKQCGLAGIVRKP